MKKILFLVLLLLLIGGPTLFARGSRSGGHSRSATRTVRKGRSAKRCNNCTRDSYGHIKRSSSAKNQFKKTHPCPSTGKTSGACRGYVIDHIKALKRGGADEPSNMQWQTKADAKAKDKIE